MHVYLLQETQKVMPMKILALAITSMLALFTIGLGTQMVKVAEAAAPLSSGIRIASPTNTTYSPRQLTVKVAFSALGGRTIEYSMAYRLDGGENVTMPVIVEGHYMSFQVTVSGSALLPKLSEGSHSVTVYSEIDIYNFSANGVFYPKYVTVDHNTVYFTIDYGQPPILRSLSLENETYNQINVPLNFTVDEPTSWIGYSLDQQDNVTIAGNFTLIGLSDGLHQVKIYANDTVGNMGVSETINFTVARETESKPFPTTFVAAASVSAAVIGAGLLIVYFKKCKP
jgi:hypothetical protein